MNISGELVPAIDVEEAVSKIGSAWNRAAESIIETAMLIVYYSKSTERNIIESALIERGIMSTSVISMLKKIGNNPLLTSPENIGKLPAAYNTLYKLAQLPDLEERMDQGLVTPYLHLEDVRRWKTDDEDREVKPSQSSEPVDGIRLVTFAQIRVPDNEEVDSDSLQSALQNLQKDFPVIEIVYPKK